MITLTVTEDQAHMIRYALQELANRRHEQIDEFSHTALLSEVTKLRTLAQQVSDRINATFVDRQILGL